MAQYRFYPLASSLQRLCRVLSALALLVSLWWWPSATPDEILWLRAPLATGLLVWACLPLPPSRAFLLDDDLSGRWLDDQSVFALDSGCRLMPGVVLLVFKQGGAPHWCFHDGYSRADWHRLCRLALKAQRGDRMVGPDSGDISG